MMDGNIILIVNIFLGSNLNDSGVFMIILSGNDVVLIIQVVSGGIIFVVLNFLMLSGGIYLVIYVYLVFGCDYWVLQNIEIMVFLVVILQNVMVDCYFVGVILVLGCLFIVNIIFGGIFQVNG